MCGLFGLLRNPAAPHPEHASLAFIMLGVLAEERGPDAAGVALLSGRPSRAPAPDGAPRYSDVRLKGCRVTKGLGTFSGMWRPGLEQPLGRAALVLGHTRWATQGGARLANASPLLTGTLAGTHNGDVDARALRAAFRLPASCGSTDSEVIYQALTRAKTTVARVKVLAALTGRAALVWADRAQPGRLYLARTALSPLAIGADTHGNLWWASNPEWLRAVERATPARFTYMALVPEGTYAVMEPGIVPRVITRRRFVPLTRPQDLRCETGVWRGYSRADRERAERPGMQRHVVTWPAARYRGAAWQPRPGAGNPPVSAASG